jgi:hypothetical protein
MFYSYKNLVLSRSASPVSVDGMKPVALKLFQGNKKVNLSLYLNSTPSWRSA